VSHHIFTSPRYARFMDVARQSISLERSGAAPASLAAAPAGAGVDVFVHRAHDVIDTLASEWAALANEASEPNAFAEHWFVAASLRTLGRDREIRLLEVRRGSRLIGLLPLIVERGYARLPLRYVQNWLHAQSFLGTPLVAAGEEAAFWSAVIAALDEAAWAPNLLHLMGIAEGGPVQRALPGETAYREVRAFLRSDLSPEAYYEQAVRQKKRKEIRRLRNRLAELGPIEARTLTNPAELSAWCDAYLAIEKAGWKGGEGSALACAPDTEAFFRDALAGAWAAGRLQFRRLDLGGRPIAMLVNFLCPPGSFSFKTVFDEAYARYSPGVLIQLENLDILARDDIDWMDSCAAEDHPMIDSLWTERRAILRVTVRLKGARRGAVFALCRALEKGSAAIRKRVR
jgi:CelD/BcsL family acetyltransferase involved in cellulose biosynthesis